MSSKTALLLAAIAAILAVYALPTNQQGGVQTSQNGSHVQLLDDVDVGSTGEPMYEFEGTDPPVEIDTHTAMQVRKCCPIGHVTFWSNETKSVKCLARPEASRPDFDWTGPFGDFSPDTFDMILAKKRPTLIVEDGVPKCDDLRALLPNEENVEDDYMIMVTGAFMTPFHGNFPYGAYCMDAFVLSEDSMAAFQPAALICPSRSWQAPTGIASMEFNGSAAFRKCCKKNQVLNSANLECVDHHIDWRGFPMTNSWDGSLLNVTNPKIIDDVLANVQRRKCARNNPLARSTSERNGNPFYLLETGHIYIPHSKLPNIFEFNRYCLDAEPQLDDMGRAVGVQDDVVLLCDPTPETVAEENREKAEKAKSRLTDSDCLKKPCVLKCCQKGLAMVENELGRPTCLASEHTWKPVFYDGNLAQVNMSEGSYTELYGFEPVCEGSEHHGKYLPQIHPAQMTYLLTNGALYSAQYQRNVSPPEYCVDTLLRYGQNEAVDMALICFPAEPPVPRIFMVYAACLIVSSIFLALTLVLTLLLPDASRLSTWTLLCYISSLLVASLLLIVMHFGHDTLTYGLCISFACVMYYFFLSAFLWLNVMSFDIWYTLSYERHDGELMWNEFFELHGLHAAEVVDGSAPKRKYGRLEEVNEKSPKKKRNLPATRSHMAFRFLKRCSYAFGMPLLMTALVLIMQFSPDLPESSLTHPIDANQRCWFSNDVAILIYFYGPIALILVANLVFFCLTAHFLNSHRQNTQNLNMRESNAKRFRLFIKLFVIMGVAWMTEIISWKAGPQEIWYITDMANALQGIFVFLVFICRRKTLEDLRNVFLSHPVLRRLFCCCCAPSMETSRSGAGTTNSRFHMTTTRGTELGNNVRNAATGADKNGKKFSFSTQDTSLTPSSFKSSGEPGRR